MHLLLETRIDELIKNSVSNLTWNSYDDRMHDGHHNVFVNTSFYNVGEDYFEVAFKAESTSTSKKYYDVVFRWYEVDKYFNVGGVRIEDNLMIYEDHIESYTFDIPRTTEAIEEFMAKENPYCREHQKS